MKDGECIEAPLSTEGQDIHELHLNRFDEAMRQRPYPHSGAAMTPHMSCKFPAGQEPGGYWMFLNFRTEC